MVDKDPAVNALGKNTYIFEQREVKNKCFLFTYMPLENLMNDCIIYTEIQLQCFTADFCLHLIYTTL